jgi:uncharacterized protein YbjQ (UPF0145 family)
VWFAAATARDARTEASLWNKEFRHLSNALKRGRDAANGRVREMAQKLGAHGVAGVHLTRRLEEYSGEEGRGEAGTGEGHILSLSLIGTAVRYEPELVRASTQTGLVVSLRDGKLAPSVSVAAAVMVVDAAPE